MATHTGGQKWFDDFAISDKEAAWLEQGKYFR